MPLNGPSWRIWVLCFLTFACFYTPQENANITTRLALTMAVLKGGHLWIDAAAPNTIDKAQWNDHYYADKAPGLSVLALPYGAATSSMMAVPEELPSNPVTRRYDPSVAVLASVATLGTIGVLMASAASMAWRWCRLGGASEAAATFATLSLVFGTIVLPWSTIFFGHAATAALLVIGFTLLSQERMLGLRRATQAGVAGLALGAAFLVEYVSAPAIAIIGVVCLADAVIRERRWRLIVEVFASAACGLVVPLMLVGTYNALAFGSPFHLGYASVTGFAGMQQGLFGIEMPQRWRVIALLFRSYRGLLPISPILVLTPLGLLIGLFEQRWRTLIVTAALVFAYYLSVNSGYYYWSGGDSTGPRHLVPSIGLLCMPLALVWDRANRVVQYLAVTLLGISSVIAFVCASVSVTFPEWNKEPLTTYLAPHVWAGEFPRLVVAAFPVPNWLGFLPIVTIWLGIGWPLISSMLARSKSQPGPAG